MPLGCAQAHSGPCSRCSCNKYARPFIHAVVITLRPMLPPAGIFLMGYGLVAVPRQLWRTADIKGAERAAYHKAGLQADRAIAAKKCVAAMQCCAWLVSL